MKIPTTRSYQEFLIESLRKSPSEAAGYVTELFEEKDPEPELLQMVLTDVVEAFGERNRKKLESLLSGCESTPIYSFADLLNALGLKLTLFTKLADAGKIMDKGTKPTSDRYHDFLIERLQDREHAAGLIEAILEEPDPEPELLRNALRKVVEARAKMNKLSSEAKQHHDRLDKMLTESGCAEIYNCVELLDMLGFRVAVTVKEG